MAHLETEEINGIPVAFPSGPVRRRDRCLPQEGPAEPGKGLKRR
jgi:hypothetical protein